jgi:hypothetical protein
MAGDLHLVLVVDDPAHSLGRVAMVLMNAGFDTVHGTLRDEAWLLARQEAGNIGMLILPAGADPLEIGSVVSELPGGTRTLAVGPQPSEEARAALRAAGAQRAVWEPWEEETLVYVVREMLAAPRVGAARKAPRVPVHLEAVLEVKGAKVGVHVTTLSLQGAFVATEVECAEGDDVDLEFWLPDGPVAARACVRSVRSDSSADGGGLGLAFTRIAEREAERLRSFVDERAELLALSDS